MTFDVTIDDSNDALISDYLRHVSENLPEVAQESAVEMIEDIYYLSAKAKKLMEEYRRNPADVCSFAELKAELGMA